MAAGRSAVRDGLAAAVPAALLSGAPSTIYALLKHRDPLEASLAAGSLLLPGERRRTRLLLAAVPVHVVLSAGWAVVLAAALPRKRPVAECSLAALGIAALDLGFVGRRYPRVRALDPLPQVADHLAFGLVTGIVLAGRSRAELNEPAGP